MQFPVTQGGTGNDTAEVLREIAPQGNFEILLVLRQVDFNQKQDNEKRNLRWENNTISQIYILNTVIFGWIRTTQVLTYSGEDIWFTYSMSLSGAKSYIN